jgi:hypothetical protein
MEEKERRRSPRNRLMIECQVEGVSPRTASRISDLSLIGCFVETITPASAGSPITIFVKVGDRQVRLNGRVARVQHDRGLGFAIEFEELSAEADAAIRRLLQAPIP